MFGNTKNSYSAPGNKFVFCKLELPDAHDGNIAINLNDAIEFYYFEDYGFHNTIVLQGCKIYNGMMILPVGNGTELNPSYMYFWDIGRKKLIASLDLRNNTTGELEDIDVYKNSIIIYTNNQGKLYQLKFQ